MLKDWEKKKRMKKRRATFKNKRRTRVRAIKEGERVRFLRFLPD